jgi:hypothetical protein
MVEGQVFSLFRTGMLLYVKMELSPREKAAKPAREGVKHAVDDLLSVNKPERLRWERRVGNNLKSGNR